MDASPDPSESPTTASTFEPLGYAFVLGVAVVTAALDLASKEWADLVLNGPDPSGGPSKGITVIESFFGLRYARNPGGAWSLFRGLPEIWRRPFFLVVTSMASVYMVSLAPRIDRRDLALKWGIALSLGGAIGNLVDRMRRGYVVDFLHAEATWGNQVHHWPTFNVADIWIVIGVGLMAFAIVTGRARFLIQDEPPFADGRDPG